VTLFKVRVLNCKSDERSEVISEVFFFISKKNIIKKCKTQSSTQEVYKKGI